jgi:hypothetical protein
VKLGLELMSSNICLESIKFKGADGHVILIHTIDYRFRIRRNGFVVDENGTPIIVGNHSRANVPNVSIQHWTINE